MDPLNLMAIANFRTSRILATPEVLNSRRKSEFLSKPIKVFPAIKKKKEPLIEEEEDV